MKDNINKKSEIIDEKEEIKANFDSLFIYQKNLDKKEGENKNIFNSQIIDEKMIGIYEEIKCKMCLNFTLDYSQCSNCHSLHCNTCKLKDNKCLNCNQIFKPKKNDRVLRNIIGEIYIKCKNVKNMETKNIK